MSNQLSQEKLETLFEIIQRRSPEQLSLLRQPLFSQKVSLDEEEREALRETLAEELCEFGLKEDSEPNKYGLLIEDLIDKLGD